MPKWTITIESPAKDMSTFDNLYFEDDRWKIPNNKVIGITKQEAGDGK